MPGAWDSRPSSLCLDRAHTTRVAPLHPCSARGGRRRIVGGLGTAQQHVLHPFATLCASAGVSGWPGGEGGGSFRPGGDFQEESMGTTQPEVGDGALQGGPRARDAFGKNAWGAETAGVTPSVGSQRRLPGGGSARRSDGRGGREDERGLVRRLFRGSWRPHPGGQSWKGNTQVTLQSLAWA